MFIPLHSDLLKYCSVSDMFPFCEKPKAAFVLFQMIGTAILLTLPRAAGSLFAFGCISHASWEPRWQSIIALLERQGQFMLDY